MQRALMTVAITALVLVVVFGAIWRWSSDGSGRYAYRFEVHPAAGRPIESAAQLGARMKRSPSAFDLVELASLELGEARRTDDPQALERAKGLLQEAEAKGGGPGAKMVGAGIADMTHHFDQTLELARAAYAENASIGAATLIATASLARGEVDEALRWADLAVRRRPLSATYFVRALVLAARGRDTEASFDFDRVIALETGGEPMEAARVRAIWGRIRLHQGFLRDARSLAKEALRIAPGSVPALALRAEVALAEGDAGEAIQRYRDAFKISRRAKFLALSARALRLDGRSDDAERARREAEGLLRRDLERETGHRLDLVEALLDGGERAAAIEARKLLETEMTIRKTPEVFAALARAEELSGRSDAALTAAHAALSAGFADTTVYAHLVRLERTVGNPMRAEMYRSLAGDAAAPPAPSPSVGAR